MRVWPRVSWRQISVCLVVLGLGLLSSARERAAAQAGAQRWDGLFEMISARYDYTPPWPTPPHPANAISRASRHPVSGDGQYVVFTSETTNWGSTTPAIYRRDRRTGQTELLFPYASPHVSISADGEHVTFDMCDPWMRPDNLPICDAWALDLRSWMWTALSTTPDGTFGNDTSGEAVLSRNGRFAVFTSKAANLTGGPAGIRQVILRDRDTDGNGVYDEPGTVALQTITAAGPGGTQFADADSESAEVSDDGRFVAFRSLASNLVPGDRNNVWDVFLRDRQMARTYRLSVRADGQESLESIDSPQIAMSADGHSVAFTSDDRLLAPSSIDDTNSASDVFVYDHQSRSLSRIDVGWTPAAGVPILGNGRTSWPAMSADGRYVSVESAATNVEVPPSVAGSTQVYVVDRLDNLVTRISVKPGGEDPDHESTKPAISADGSVVLFWSRASNLVNTAAPTVDQLFAAVHFTITPDNVLVPARGGNASYIVTAQQHTMWWAEWDYSQSWFGPTASAPYGIGNGTMDFTARQANPDPTERSATIKVAQATATLTQDVGLSLTSISPTSGPMAGGTTITLRGTGFEPGMFAFVGDRVDATFVDATTLTVITPPHDRRETVPVSVGTSDGRYAWLEQAFTFTDSTPPQVMGWATGTLGQNEWFVGDVTVVWGYYDPDSEVTSTCPAVQVTSDTPGTTYTCSASSEGGTGSAQVQVKRDATPPAIAVATPAPMALLELNSAVNADFTCTDPVSGVASCGGVTPSGSPLDTTTPGWKTLSVGATDVAGNYAPLTVEYAVSNGACTAPGDGLESWMRFNGNLNDAMNGPNTINTVMPPDSYVDGKSGQAYNFVSRGGQSLELWHYGRMNFDGAMSVAMWLKPGSATNGTLVKHKDQYRLERASNGAINWTLLHPTSGPSFGTSTAKAPLNTWAHVVFTYAAGEVKVYVNGRLDRTWNQSAATLQPTSWSRIRIGGPDEWGGWPFVGAFDELQFFSRALADGEVEQIFLSGTAGLCAPVQTVLEVPSIATTYGAGTYPAVAVLRDGNGTPLTGKTLRLEQRAFNVAGQQLASTTMVTDATGTVRWDAPFDVNAGTYPTGFTAHFAGDLEHAPSEWVTASLVVAKATPQLAWATPVAITYGAGLSHAAQLNATADVAGSFNYTPGAGAVPRAGTQPLLVTFVPSDYQNYDSTTATVNLVVGKAQPVMTIAGGTFTYDGQPHGATASAADFRGTALTPVSVTYGGSPEAPVAAGVYAAVATYAGDANHEARSVTATVTIDKATAAIAFSAPLTFTYDGQPHGVTASVRDIGGDVIGTATVTYDGAPEAPVNAGVYTASARFDGNANYQANTVSTTVRINPATPSITVSGGPFVYDNQPHGATVSVTGVAGEALANPAVVTYSGAAALPVNAGSYTVAARYDGAANYEAATATGSLTIEKATVVLSVTGGTFTYDGQPHPATVTATGISGETVTPVVVTYWRDGFGWLDAPIAAGTYDVAATYQGSANYLPKTEHATIVVGKATPQLTWVAPASIVYGTALGAAQLNATTTVPGTFSYSPIAGTRLAAGAAHTLTAAFVPADPANYAIGSVSTAIAVTPAPLVVRAADAVKRFGAPLPAFAATFAGLVNGESPSVLNGTLAFGTTATQTSPVGSYPVVVAGLSSPNYAIAFANGTLTVVKGSVAVSVSSNPAPVGFEMPVRLTATVAAEAPAVGSPAGTIRFFYGDTLLGAVAAVDGTAVLTTAGLDAGAHSIEARFDGDAAFDPGTGSSPLTANTAALTPALAMTSSRNPSNSGQSVTITATVAMSSGPVSGSVAFYDGNQLLGTSAISGGRATLTTSSLPPGSHALTGRYLGEAAPASYSAVLVQAVGAGGWKDRATTLTLATSADTAALGDAVVFTATVSGSWSATPGGRVLFMVNGEVVGDPEGVVLTAVGEEAGASLTVPGLAHGRHNVTATYLGDSTYKGSTARVTQVVD